MAEERTDKGGKLTLRQIAVRSYRQNKTGYVLLWALLCCGAIFCAVQMFRISRSGRDPVQTISRQWDIFCASDASYYYADTDAVVAAARKSFYPIQVFSEGTLVIAYITIIIALTVAVAFLSFRVKNVTISDRIVLFACSLLCYMILLGCLLFWYDSMTFTVGESYILACGDVSMTMVAVIIFLSVILSPAYPLIYAVFRIIIEELKLREAKRN